MDDSDTNDDKDKGHEWSRQTLRVGVGRPVDLLNYHMDLAWDIVAVNVSDKVRTISPQTEQLCAFLLCCLSWHKAVLVQVWSDDQ